MMEKNVHFIKEAISVAFPITVDSLILEALQSEAQWFVLKEGHEVRGCINRFSFYETVKERGLNNTASINLDKIMKEAIIIAEEEVLQYHPFENDGKVPVIQDRKGEVQGVIHANDIFETVDIDNFPMEELKRIYDEIYQSMFLTDEKGNVISAADSKDKQYISQNVFDLEKQREFYPSISAKVLKSGQRERGIQYTQSGEIFDIESIPIKDEKGSIVKVVSVTKEVSEINKLSKQIKDYKKIIEHYEHQVIRLNQSKIKEEPFIYASKEMESIHNQVSSVASVDTTVLILGETGVGKEMVAKQIYLLSSRRDQPFIPVNCGAIPEQLLESELFGYEDGAFSGARKGGKIGIFEAAHQGTVFLDEIGELPLQFQVKLLRVLQEKKITRVGGTKEKEIDVRIVAATNNNLEKRVKEGTFREDLYYRINVIPLQIPPLRERKEDISTLVFYFLDLFNHKHHKNMTIYEGYIQKLLNYPWPGNVRQLSNVIERFVITGQEIIPETTTAREKDKEATKGELPNNLTSYLKEVEKDLLSNAREKYKTTRDIAKALGVNQSTISRKLQKYNL